MGQRIKWRIFSPIGPCVTGRGKLPCRSEPFSPMSLKKKGPEERNTSPADSLLLGERGRKRASPDGGVHG